MSTTAASTALDQIVVLDLAGESYGVEIGRVQEIIRMQAIAAIPNSPEFVEGITNLRGRVIPVMDLRRRFRMAHTETTSDSRIVVAEVGEYTVGLIVDGVSEVLRISPDMVEPPSALVSSEDSELLRGVAKIDDRLVVLLDLAHLLNGDEQGELAREPE